MTYTKRDAIRAQFIKNGEQAIPTLSMIFFVIPMIVSKITVFLSYRFCFGCDL